VGKMSVSIEKALSRRDVRRKRGIQAYRSSGVRERCPDLGKSAISHGKKAPNPLLGGVLGLLVGNVGTSATGVRRSVSCRDRGFSGVLG